MNEIKNYFINNKNRGIMKQENYFDVYDRHLSKFRGKDVNIVEIGVYHGGSLQMWKEYFGDKCNVFGIDINSDVKKFEEERIKIFIGDQSNRDFLSEVKNTCGRIDILVDDGGHTMDQQTVTFDEMYDFLSIDGVYICEDLHTSYWQEFGGGYLKNGTFVEKTKTFIDKIHAFHSKDDRLTPDKFTKTTRSIHFYDSIIVLEKGPMEKQRTYYIGKSPQDTDEK